MSALFPFMWKRAQGRKWVAVGILVGMSMGCVAAPPPPPLSTQLQARLPKQGPLAEAVRAIREGRLDDAAQALNVGLSAQPRRPELHFMNAYVYEQKGELDLAEIGYRLALDFDPGYWLAAHRLGRLYFAQGRYASARDMFSRAVIAAPERPEPTYDLAVASYVLADPLTAQAALQNLPDTHAPHVVRARALVAASLGADEQARVHLARYEASGAPQWAVRSASQRVQAWAEQHHDVVGGGAAALPAPTPPETTETSTPTPPRMFVVDAVIITRERSRSSSRGLNLLSALQVQFGGSLLDATRSTAKDLSTGGFTSFADSVNHAVAVTVPAVAYSLNIANAQNSTSEILARPSVMAYDGESSEIFVGNELTYTTNGQLAGASFSKEVGLMLKVRPERTEDAKIRMQVETRFDVFQPTAAPGSFDQAVATVKNRNQVTVEMHLGQTLALAAGTLTRKARLREGVPILRDIPILQYLFSTWGESEQKTSILVLLTPRRPTGEALRQPGDSAALRALKRRYGHWWTSTSNTLAAMSRLDSEDLRLEFRRGDVQFVDADDSGSRFMDLLQDVADLLYF